MDTKRDTNNRSLAAPNKYVQGPGVFEELPRFTEMYGGNPTFIVDVNVAGLFDQRIIDLYSSDLQPVVLHHEGEITEAAVDLVTQRLSKSNSGVIVAVGGGKTIDTAKISAHNVGKPTIVVPTSASSDAPCSSLGVVYKESGEHSHEVFLPLNPTLVLVDTQIIAAAPSRLLVSGMGDALATYFESEANAQNGSVNVVTEELGIHLGGGLAARAIAELCYETLLANGRAAKMASDLHVVTPALENVVEANTLLSGIGFESNGTAAAHAINDGISALPAGAKMLHGERVAFGVLCELVMENADEQLRETVRKFCADVGLPITLAELGLRDITAQELDLVVDTAYRNVIHAEPMIVTHELIRAAIVTADAEGQGYRALMRA